MSLLLALTFCLWVLFLTSSRHEPSRLACNSTPQTFNTVGLIKRSSEIYATSMQTSITPGKCSIVNYNNLEWPVILNSRKQRQQTVTLICGCSLLVAAVLARKTAGGSRVACEVELESNDGKKSSRVHIRIEKTQQHIRISKQQRQQWRSLTYQQALQHSYRRPSKVHKNKYHRQSRQVSSLCKVLQQLCIHKRPGK